MLGCLPQEQGVCVCARRVTAVFPACSIVSPFIHTHYHTHTHCHCTPHIYPGCGRQGFRGLPWLQVPHPCGRGAGHGAAQCRALLALSALGTALLLSHPGLPLVPRGFVLVCGQVRSREWPVRGGVSLRHLVVLGLQGAAPLSAHVRAVQGIPRRERNQRSARQVRGAALVSVSLSRSFCVACAACSAVPPVLLVLLAWLRCRLGCVELWVPVWMVV